MKTLVSGPTQEPVEKQRSCPLINLVLLGLVALLGATSQPAWAQLPDATQDYTIQLIEPPEGAVAVWWTLMSQSGLVVMQYPREGDDPRFMGHTAILEKGEWRNIDVPGSISTGVGAPTASGRVPLPYVCEEAEGVFVYHSAIFHRGTYTFIPDHEFYQFALNSMNDQGSLVGIILDLETPGVYRGLVFNASLSLFDVVDVPGASSTVFYGINNAGLVVGRYDRGNQSPGLLYDGHTFTDIVVPGASMTGALSINNRNTIVGFYESGQDGSWHGFVLEKGVLKELRIPAELVAGEPYWMSVDCITDDGQLSGEFGDDNGDHGFIATPKPSRE